MNFPERLQKTGQWLRGEGPDADIVISTRVRLARNLRGRHFTARLDYRESQTINQEVCRVLESGGYRERLNVEAISELPTVERQFFVERHLISRELSHSELCSSVGYNDDESVSIMVNEEDHLRIQAVYSGFQLDSCWKLVDEVDTWLDSKLDYSYSPRFGYLTACPTNVGTGMRASVMLHLPALAMTRQIDKVYQSLGKLNLVVRGLFGEGTTAMGDFYQISNQGTLSRTEADILDVLQRIVPQILQYERSIRATLSEEQGKLFEDKLWRSLGILKHARKLKIEETLDFLSAVRLGINFGAFEGIGMRAINDLFILSQPAHLRLLHKNREKDKEKSRDKENGADIDVLRADLVRSVLSQA